MAKIKVEAKRKESSLKLLEIFNTGFEGYKSITLKELTDKTGLSAYSIKQCFKLLRKEKKIVYRKWQQNKFQIKNITSVK